MIRICRFHVAAFFVVMLVSNTTFAFTANGYSSTDLPLACLHKVTVMASDTRPGGLYKAPEGLAQGVETPDKNKAMTAIEDQT
ncbi:MAG: hypothetical protein JRJ85_09560, partial [Deltaproteobacteria bacterium]|nr:hypothetical protein [Deltaproteobacteria bacterium]